MSELGFIEEVPETHRAYGMYKYRVIGRDGFANHHTNSLRDAELWLEKCREQWGKSKESCES